MSAPQRLFRGLVSCLAAASVAGCVSLLPKDKPVQLYRFGESAAPGAAHAPAASAFLVRSAATSFERAAAGDRILTVQGDQAAYIKGARWVSPAAILFEAAVARAFDADGGAARLLARGEAARAELTLELDVRTFEARYGSDPQAAPIVRIEVYAALGAPAAKGDRARLFAGEAAASDNRVGAIAIAFDQATNKVLGELVAWVDAKGEG